MNSLCFLRWHKYEPVTQSERANYYRCSLCGREAAKAIQVQDYADEYCQHILSGEANTVYPDDYFKNKILIFDSKFTYYGGAIIDVLDVHSVKATTIIMPEYRQFPFARKKRQLFFVSLYSNDSEASADWRFGTKDEAICASAYIKKLLRQHVSHSIY